VSTFPIPPERLIEMAKDVLRAGEGALTDWGAVAIECTPTHAMH
jgi:hypothetical protein